MVDPFISTLRISQQVYEAFCFEGDSPIEETLPNYEDRATLERMIATKSFRIVKSLEDEFLGLVEPAIIHDPSGKLVISIDVGCTVVAVAMRSLATEPKPTVKIISKLMSSYIGLPPPPTLRAMVDAGLKEVLPRRDEIRKAKVQALVVARKGEKAETSYAGLVEEFAVEPGPVERKVVVINSPEDYYQDVDFAKAFENPNHETGLPDTALEDDFYDYICGLLAGIVPKNAIPDVFRNEIEKVLESPSLRLEDWNNKGHYLNDGLRLIHVNPKDMSEKFYVKTSEVFEVWRSFYNSESGSTLSDTSILQIIAERYVGIGHKALQKQVISDKLMKGKKVIFPKQPRMIGSKAMEFIQIDVVDMQHACHEFQDYCSALVITDLYSGFVFGKPLSGADKSFDSDTIPSFITRVVGDFGPPVAYRSATLDFKNLIEDAMEEVSELFSQKIRFAGQGPILTRDLETEVYNRAEKGDIGDRNQWVMGFPFAVIQYNHAPNRKFDYFLSPFEVMFKRKACNSSIPPWVSSEKLEMNKAIMLNHYFRRQRIPKPSKIPPMDDPEFVFKCTKSANVDAKQKEEFLDFMKDRTVESFDELIERFTAPHTLPTYDEDGRLTDPGSGQKFEVGDKVYVRNPLFFNKNRLPDRYYRALIVEVDEKHPESLYKCMYWADDQELVDSMPANVWPEEHETGNYRSSVAWFAWWDVVGITIATNKARAIQDPEVRCEQRCHCGCGRKIIFKGCSMDEKCCVFAKRSCDAHKDARRKLYEVGHFFDAPLFNEMIKDVIPSMKFEFQTLKATKVANIIDSGPGTSSSITVPKKTPVKQEKFLDVSLPIDFLKVGARKDQNDVKRGRPPGKIGRPKGGMNKRVVHTSDVTDEGKPKINSESPSPTKRMKTVKEEIEVKGVRSSRRLAMKQELEAQEDQQEYELSV